MLNSIYKISIKRRSATCEAPQEPLFKDVLNIIPHLWNVQIDQIMVEWGQLKP